VCDRDAGRDGFVSRVLGGLKNQTVPERLALPFSNTIASRRTLMPAKMNVFLSKHNQMIPGYGFAAVGARVPREGEIMETGLLANLANAGMLQAWKPIDVDVMIPTVEVVGVVQGPVDRGTVLRPGLSAENLAPLPVGTKLDQHVLPMAAPSLAPVVPLLVEVVTVPVVPVADVIEEVAAPFEEVVDAAPVEVVPEDLPTPQPQPSKPAQKQRGRA
jgi:hypothetical protein